MTYIAKNTPEGADVPKPGEPVSSQPASASFFDQLPPKTALVIGLVASVLLLCTIGFIILLTIFLGGGK